MSKNKPTQEDYHTVRITKRAEAVFSKASKLPIQEAFALIAVLIGNSIKEICEVKKYSSRTGKPIEFFWKPGDVWDGKLWLPDSCTSPSLEEGCPLCRQIKEEFGPGKVMIVGAKGQKVIVEHFPERSEGGFGSMGDQGGTIPAYISFKKAG